MIIIQDCLDFTHAQTHTLELTDLIICQAYKLPPQPPTETV